MGLFREHYRVYEGNSRSLDYSSYGGRAPFLEGWAMGTRCEMRDTVAVALQLEFLASKSCQGLEKLTGQQLRVLFPAR